MVCMAALAAVAGVSIVRGETRTSPALADECAVTIAAIDALSHGFPADHPDRAHPLSDVTIGDPDRLLSDSRATYRGGPRRLTDCPGFARQIVKHGWVLTSPSLAQRLHIADEHYNWFSRVHFDPGGKSGSLLFGQADGAFVLKATLTTTGWRFDPPTGMIVRVG